MGVCCSVAHHACNAGLPCDWQGQVLGAASRRALHTQLQPAAENQPTCPLAAESGSNAFQLPAATAAAAAVAAAAEGKPSGFVQLGDLQLTPLFAPTVSKLAAAFAQAVFCSNVQAARSVAKQSLLTSLDLASHPDSSTFATASQLGQHASSASASLAHDHASAPPASQAGIDLWKELLQPASADDKTPAIAAAPQGVSEGVSEGVPQRSAERYRDGAVDGRVAGSHDDELLGAGNMGAPSVQASNSVLPKVKV